MSVGCCPHLREPGDRLRCRNVNADRSQRNGGGPCGTTTSKNRLPFERMSKRRRGYPSETQVKRGVRIVGGYKLLEEKLGRNDLCPCGSGRSFKNCCLSGGLF